MKLTNYLCVLSFVDDRTCQKRKIGSSNFLLAWPHIGLTKTVPNIFQNNVMRKKTTASYFVFTSIIHSVHGCYLLHSCWITARPPSPPSPAPVTLTPPSPRCSPRCHCSSRRLCSSPSSVEHSPLLDPLHLLHTRKTCRKQGVKRYSVLPRRGAVSRGWRRCISGEEPTGPAGKFVRGNEKQRSRRGSTPYRGWKPIRVGSVNLRGKNSLPVKCSRMSAENSWDCSSGRGSISTKGDGAAVGRGSSNPRNPWYSPVRMVRVWSQSRTLKDNCSLVNTWKIIILTNEF